MDRYSIFGSENVTAAAPAAAPANRDISAQPVERRESSSGGDPNGSLATSAEQDLLAALQLLVERAQFVTGASGAMVALLENGRMICRASVGLALQPGTSMQVDSGLTKESLQQKQLLRCDDTEQDSGVNRDACRALGIRSVMVAPLLRDSVAAGIFELLGEQPHAFEENDASSLEWLAQCAVTAMDHADATRRIIEGKVPNEPAVVKAVATMDRGKNILSSVGKSVPIAGISKTAVSQPPGIAKSALTKQCARCGFPVSPERLLCVDCEALEDHSSSSGDMSPDPLSQFAPASEEGWFERNMYTIGTLAIAALTVLAAWLKFH